MPTPATIVMIDDQTSYADALGLALSLTDDLRLIAHAPDAQTGQELCQTLNPDLIICDYRLPDRQTGVTCTNQLRTAGITTPVIILTAFPAPQVIRETTTLDNTTIASKDRTVTELINGIRTILTGDHTGTLLTPHVIQLSPGEQEVLELLNQGHTPTEIAETIHLSIHTIRARIKTLLRKLDATSQIEALATATRLGLLVPPN